MRHGILSAFVLISGLLVGCGADKPTAAVPRQTSPTIPAPSPPTPPVAPPAAAPTDEPNKPTPFKLPPPMVDQTDDSNPFNLPEESPPDLAAIAAGELPPYGRLTGLLAEEYAVWLPGFTVLFAANDFVGVESEAAFGIRSATESGPVMTVIQMQFTEPVSAEQMRALAPKFLRPFTADNQGEPTVTPGTFQDAEALDVRGESMFGDRKEALRARIFTRGNSIFCLLCTGSEEALDKTEAESFFASFRRAEAGADVAAAPSPGSLYRLPVEPRAETTTMDFKSVNAVRYSEVATLGREAGLVEIYRPPVGKVICAVNYSWQLNWGKDRAFKVELKDFGLAEGKQIGLIDPFGAAKFELPSEYSPAVQKNVGYDVLQPTYAAQTLFLIDEKVEEVNFLFGGTKHKVKLAAPAAPYDPTKLWKVDLKSVRRLEEIKDQRVMEYEPFHEKIIRNEGGHLLAVTLTLTPQNFADHDALVSLKSSGLETQPFRLSFGKGGLANCLGTIQRPDAVSNHSPKFDEKLGPLTVTLLYPVPANVRSFELTYHGHPLCPLPAEEAAP